MRPTILAATALLLAPLATLAPSAPAQGTGTVPIQPVPPLALLPHTVLAEGIFGPPGIAAKDLVIRNARQFVRVWKSTFGNGVPVPAVDFQQEEVYAIFQGFQSTGGYAVDVQMVTSDFFTIDVVVTDFVPGPTCIVPQVFTSPFQIVKVPKVGSPPVTFHHNVVLCE